MRVRFRVRGRLSERFASAIDGVVLDPTGDGSVLVGELRDASAVYAVIDRLRELGLELRDLESEPVEPAYSDAGHNRPS